MCALEKWPLLTLAREPGGWGGGLYHHPSDTDSGHCDRRRDVEDEKGQRTMVSQRRGKNQRDSRRKILMVFLQAQLCMETMERLI